MIAVLLAVVADVGCGGMGEAKAAERVLESRGGRLIFGFQKLRGQGHPHKADRAPLKQRRHAKACATSETLGAGHGSAYALQQIAAGLLDLRTTCEAKAPRHAKACATSFQAGPTFEQVVGRAADARQREQVDEALALYRQGLRMRPSWKEGWWFLGTLLYDRDRYDEAQPAFLRLLDLEPKNGPALALLGLCEYRTKDYGPALTHLNRARALGFGDNQQMMEVVFYHSALLLTRYKRFESALELLVEIAQRGMTGPKIVEAAGLAALRMPILPQDIPETDRDLVLMTGRAVCAAGERDVASAQKQFDELVTRYPKAPNVHYVYGAFQLLSSPDDGLREFLRELEVNHDHLPSLIAISLEYVKRGEPDKGVEYAQRAIKAAPESFAAHAALGRVLVESGKVNDGIKRLEYAEKLAPDSPQVRIALASAYAKVGRTTDAARERAAFQRLKQQP